MQKFVTLQRICLRRLTHRFMCSHVSSQGVSVTVAKQTLHRIQENFPFHFRAVSCRNYFTTTCPIRNDLDTNKDSSLNNSKSHESSWIDKTFQVENIEETRKLAEQFSKLLQNTDVVLLTGDMGSGKSVFARHIIRVLEKDMNLNVPSPTFLLDNIYENKISGNYETIHHIDLYRLDRFDRLDLPHIFTNGISLIEWGNRLLEDNDMMKQPHHSYIRDVLLDSSKCHMLIILFENAGSNEQHCNGANNSIIPDNEEYESPRSITFLSSDSTWKERLAEF
ncbi:hypothetical protein C9374_008772 [Naegleria lovaniensis]|uniref:tRNA threonylcarbamoyladenosine biosynthesis protein TsaE n=1 Tax=Naegleria lovaniensis TaxID=51637 RepID=A0AA88GJD3_NAELO|nr:uncharacterized protein C9374_008772 [Naegleria lovaniensis]KAG2378150.1 hypothetical protein C9374_008772 [Naegleria lovaniensis]